MIRDDAVFYIERSGPVKAAGKNQLREQNKGTGKNRRKQWVRF